MARISAISRERWVTIIVKVFQMMKAPTNRAMPAKIMKRIPTIFRSFSMASAFSFATVLPVTASAPAGTTASRRSASSVWLTPSSALTSMVSKKPGVTDELLRGDGVEVRRRGAAEVLLVAEADGADHGEVLGRAWNRTLMVEPSAMSFSSALVASMATSFGLSGASPVSRSTSPRSFSSAACCSPCVGAPPLVRMALPSLSVISA